MKIEMGKQYRTVGGCDVRILCIDSGCPGLPVVAIVTPKNGDPWVIQRRADGTSPWMYAKDQIVEVDAAEDAARRIIGNSAPAAADAAVVAMAYMKLKREQKETN